MKENRYILSFIIFLLSSLSIHSQTHSDLRTTVEEALVSLKPEHLAIGEIKLDTLLLEKGNKLVVQMNDEFSYLPFRKELVKRAYDTIRSILPPDLKKKKLFILTSGYEISELIPFADNRKRFEIHCERPIVSPIKCHYLPTKGLLNRHIALWQSHGYYFEQSLNRWEWQRARIFETVEDLYTQSFVMPFLTPMLQNAGAYVFSPRERDTNRHELIADNDNADTYFETGTEKVKWENGLLRTLRSNTWAKQATTNKKQKKAGNSRQPPHRSYVSTISHEQPFPSTFFILFKRLAQQSGRRCIVHFYPDKLSYAMTTFIENNNLILRCATEQLFTRTF